MQKKLKECQNCERLILKGNLCEQCREELQQARVARKAEQPNRVYGEMPAYLKGVIPQNSVIKS
jgi:predicted amidophosphoribosyltransferase